MYKFICLSSHLSQRTSSQSTQGQGGRLVQLEQTVSKMSNPVQSGTSHHARGIDPQEEINPMAPETVGITNCSHLCR